MSIPNERAPLSRGPLFVITSHLGTPTHTDTAHALLKDTASAVLLMLRAASGFSR